MTAIRLALALVTSTAFAALAFTALASPSPCVAGFAKVTSSSAEARVEARQQAARL
jgi:hypothetical protein